MAAITAAFSPSGEFLVYSSPDGTLKLWETSTGTLSQEYTPSSHLSATCTCISWGPSRRMNESPKRKKKKRDSVAPRANVDLIAIGTLSGNILLYSVSKGDLHSQLEGGHTDQVNDICWSSDGNRIYSCSHDQHIIEWDISTGKIKSKWKDGKGSVFSVCLCSSERRLLSASRSIKLWDLEKKDVIRSFTGHASEVFRMLPVNVRTTEESQTESSYFLSAASGDRLINAWQMGSISKDKNAIASFALPDEPKLMTVSPPNESNKPTLMAAVTKTGQIVIFEHVLNGKCKKPLSPKVTLQVASDDAIPQPIPLLAVYISDGNVLIARGDFLKPVFENIPYSSMESEMCLVRGSTSKSASKLENHVTKVKTPDTTQEVNVLGPGHMAPAKPSTSTGNEVKSKRRRRKSSTELTMEDRLHAMGLDKSDSTTSAKVPPKADTLALLLTQGLQSGDKKILNNVLQHSNETIIRNTVKRLPVHIVIPLIKQLSKRMHGHAQSGLTCVKWIKQVLTLHTSFLMTHPQIVEKLGSLYQMMDARVTVFQRLSKLQGKLGLMLSQITSQEEEEETVAGQQPMLVYQDESSDEDMMEEDFMGSHSESEDNWEELSDMEVNEEENGQSEDEENGLVRDKKDDESEEEDSEESD